MTAAIFEERVDLGQAASAALSAMVHVALLVVLVFGVSWQNRPPESIAVELWDAPPPAPAAVEAQKPLPKVEPPPVPVVKPEPVVPKPEIAVKAPEKIKPVPKPVPKAEPLKPRVDDTQKRFREELAREQASLAVNRESQQIRDQLAREADAARNRGLADYEAKIRNKVRGNIVLPPDIQGNPEAHFLVVQLPTGEVLSSRLVKSSGYRAYDEAVERAILKSSPLPRPDRAELFSRELKLTFRPRD
jgi:colicin import membrane protein